MYLFMLKLLLSNNISSYQVMTFGSSRCVLQTVVSISFHDHDNQKKSAATDHVLRESPVVDWDEAKITANDSYSKDG